VPFQHIRHEHAHHIPLAAHLPLTIFTEIEPRRWKVGSPAIQSSAGFRLFEGLGTQAATPSDTASRPTL